MTSSMKSPAFPREEMMNSGNAGEIFGIVKEVWTAVKDWIEDRRRRKRERRERERKERIEKAIDQEDDEKLRQVIRDMLDPD